MSISIHRWHAAALAICAWIALPAAACIMCTMPTASVLPGLSFRDGLIGLSFPILTGLIETPILLLLGIKHRTISIAILTNYISMLFAVLASILLINMNTSNIYNALWSSDYVRLSIFLLTPFFVTVLVEYFIFIRIKVSSRIRFFSFMFFANLISACTLIFVPVLPLWKDGFDYMARTVFYAGHWGKFETQSAWIQLITIVICIGVIIVAFVRARGFWDQSTKPAEKRGFDMVIPKSD